MLKELLIPIVVCVVGVILTAYITIKVKFASSETEVITGLKKIGINILWFIGFVAPIYGLIKHITSADPITRGDVFSIAFFTGSFLFVALMHLISKILDHIGIILLALHKHLRIPHCVISLPNEQDASVKANLTDETNR